MIELEIVNFISNLGFPIALSIYFVFKVEKTISNNTAAMGEIKAVIVACQKRR